MLSRTGIFSAYEEALEDWCIRVIAVGDVKDDFPIDAIVRRRAINLRALLHRADRLRDVCEGEFRHVPARAAD